MSAHRRHGFVDLGSSGNPLIDACAHRAAAPRNASMLPLRSFTRSPLTIKYPKCDKPMRLVYWGCWVDNTGEQGPYSATLVTRLDGDHLQLVQTKQQRREQTIIITSGQRALP